MYVCIYLFYSLNIIYKHVTWFNVCIDHKMVGDWWTSGAYIMHQRQWMWTSRHHVRAIEQPRWATGAPRDREPSSTRCLKLHKTDRHEWFDAVCTERHHYICEVEIE